MVDMNLVQELKQKLDAGVDNVKPEDTLRVFEYMKQLSKEFEDLKDELEDVDLKMQVIITDVDKKYWVTAKPQGLDYGTGTIDNPSFTWKAPLSIAAQIVFGQIQAQNAFMNGSIQIDGKIKDAMLFQNILEISMDQFRELTEKVITI